MLLNTQAPQKHNPRISVLSLKVLSLVMPMRPLLRMVVRRTIPPKWHLWMVKKNNFPSAIPNCCKFSNQNYESCENGYDSDGELVYFDDCAKMGEDTDMFFEDALCYGATEVMEPAPVTKTTPSDACWAVAVAFTREQIMSMSVRDLKDKLKKGEDKVSKKENYTSGAPH